MHKWSRLRRTLIVLALIGFALPQFGCYFAMNRDYEVLMQQIGSAVIKLISDNVFGNIGTDFDAVVRTPVTAFAQSLWNNYAAAYVPNDIELK
jgi:hypothetical protein